MVICNDNDMFSCCWEPAQRCSRTIAQTIPDKKRLPSKPEMLFYPYLRYFLGRFGQTRRSITPDFDSRLGSTRFFIISHSVHCNWNYGGHQISCLNGLTKVIRLNHDADAVSWTCVKIVSAIKSAKVLKKMLGRVVAALGLTQS
jgi:hypothetical protein